MKMIKNAEDAYVKISRLTEKSVADTLNSSSISEADEILAKYEKERESILKSEQITGDVSVFDRYTSSDWQSIGIYCDMSIIEGNNKRLTAMMRDANDHVQKLKEQAESKVDDAEIDESGVANEKIIVIQKIAAKFSEFVKKISSILTRITINIMRGINIVLTERKGYVLKTKQTKQTKQSRQTEQTEDN
jgi:ribosomal protein L22